MKRALLLSAALTMYATCSLSVAAEDAESKSAVAAFAIVVRDQTPLRSQPRDSAQQQALLWQGEVVEVRGARADYLQVWDYQRERGGFIETSRVYLTSLTAGDAPELLAVLRYLRGSAGSEALAIGFAAAYLKAAPAEVLRNGGAAEVLEAIGTLAERLAQRASTPPSASTPGRSDALAAHLEVATHYGISFVSVERDGAMRICYDGDAYRRVLTTDTDAARRAHAALGLTRPECIDSKLSLTARLHLDESRAEMLDRVDEAALPTTLRNRVAMRRAGVWAALAFQRARRGDGSAEAAAKRALGELAAVNSYELADSDLSAWNDAAIQVGAARWAAGPAEARTARAVRIVTAPREPGETCVSLVDNNRREHETVLATRCTFGVVWAGSASLNREGNALALAVQPLEGWRELWIFRKHAGSWTVQALPPASVAPALGYAEFAGWVPGGTQLLVAREVRGERGYKRSFELLRIDDLATVRQANDPAVLGAFQRWQDAEWKRDTVSIR